MRLRFTLAIALLSTLVLGSAANSHDLLVDIEPAENSVVTESNFQAVLTFNNPLLVIEGESNAEVATQLVGTEEWQVHEISITDRVLTSSISLSEPGEYLLRWSVVSSDGHPISGESTFTLDIEPLTSPEQSEEPMVISPNPTQEQSASNDSLTGFYIGLGMVALGAIFAPIGLLMRRRAKKS